MSQISAELEALARSSDGSPQSLERLNEHVGKYLPMYVLAAVTQNRRSTHAPAPAGDGFMRHLRSYLPLYALATVWVFMLVLFPSVNRSGVQSSGGTGTTSGATSGSEGLNAAPSDATTAAADAAQQDSGGGSPGAAAASASAGGRRAASAGSSGSASVGKVATETGVTRGGVQCGPGVRQIPLSTYAAPCVGKFEGDNGGATFRGVTKDTIKFAVRVPADSGGPNAQTVDEVNRAAGRADRTGALNLLRLYSDYFNKTYELYGRKVTFEQVNGQGIGTEEAQSKGREASCADATDIVGKGYFGDLLFATSFIEYEPFSWCAAERKLFLPLGAAYFPESFYKKWHPYVWNAVTLECEQIGRDMAEYLGKRMLNRKAKWAGDPLLQQQNRSIGIYVPDNDGYQQCINIEEKLLKEQYNYKAASRYNYALDVSRFPDQAAQAMIQFKAAGVTTVQNSCDTLSTQFMTQAARAQNFYPEWWIIGVAAQDLDGSARQYDQTEVDGHLFGMSQLGAEAKINSKEGEAYKVWKLAYPGQEPPTGFGGVYFSVLHIFNLLQSSGPILNPENIARAIQALPPSTGIIGTWDLRQHHTQVSDAREVYWNGTVTGYDGKAGAYIETYGGKRFRSGEWAAEEPPVYPKK
jgi:hypothetical protein